MATRTVEELLPPVERVCCELGGIEAAQEAEGDDRGRRRPRRLEPRRDGTVAADEDADEIELDDMN